jgi:hypothetical protein
MALSTLSMIGSIKGIKQEEALPYTDCTFDFIGGTDYTNNGEFPFQLNKTLNNTICRINNISASEFASSGGFTLWMRIQVDPGSFDRIYNFTTNVDNIGAKKSFSFCSFNGTNYNQLNANATINNSAIMNVITPSIFNTTNTFNIFIPTIVLSNQWWQDFYVFDNLGNQLYYFGTTTLLSNYNNKPIDQFNIFHDGTFDSRVSSGTIYKVAKFNYVLSSSERQLYSSMAL